MLEFSFCVPFQRLQGLRELAPVGLFVEALESMPVHAEGIALELRSGLSLDSVPAVRVACPATSSSATLVASAVSSSGAIIASSLCYSVGVST